MSDRPGIAADRPLKVLIAADTYPPHVNGAATFGHRLARAQLRGEIGICGAGFGNEADHIAATKDAAACAVHSPSGTVSR